MSDAPPKKKEEKERFFVASLEAQVNAGIHEIVRGNRTHLGEREARQEHTGKLYTRASCAGGDPRRTPESFPKSITTRNAVDLLLEFRDSKWKGVDFRRPRERAASARGERDEESHEEKRNKPVRRTSGWRGREGEGGNEEE